MLHKAIILVEEEIERGIGLVCNVISIHEKKLCYCLCVYAVQCSVAIQCR
jgi:hypothetical protein